MTATEEVSPPTNEPTTAAETFAARSRSPIQRVQHVLHSHPTISPALVLIVSVIVFAQLNSRFSSPESLSLVLQQIAVVAGLAVGQTLIILTAGIDLSVGALTILSMMVMAKLSQSPHGMPGILALGIGIGVAAIGGLINGTLVTRVKLPPFIVTLGTLSIFAAIGLLYSKAASISASSLPSSINWTSNTFSVGSFTVTYGVVVVLVIYGVVAFALSQTAWGKHVYAVGDDPEASLLAGIRVSRVLLSVYVVAGVIYGIGAWVLIGRSGGADTNALTDANLESITAVVIGGTSLFGGRGVVGGTLIGALIVGAFRSGLSLAGVNDQYRVFAIGVLIIAAVAIDQWIRKVRA